MPPLKPLSPEAVPGALEKAHRYRLLNEPLEAESICRDILEIAPDHQEANHVLLLALTDQFADRLTPCYDEARERLAHLADEYSRRYYHGIVCERRAKAHLARGGLHAGLIAYDWLLQAMEHFEKAAELRPPGNDDAILRYNTCVRLMESNPALAPEAQEERTASWLE
jgi:hypothetical protein